MQVSSEKTLLLCDARQRELGRIVVGRAASDLITGTFYPGQDFAPVQHLFHDFEEAVNCQALAVVDELGAAIGSLGLRLVLPDDSQPLAIHDVQIWCDGGFSCRPATRPNDGQAAARQVQATKP